MNHLFFISTFLSIEDEWVPLCYTILYLSSRKEVADLVARQLGGLRRREHNRKFTLYLRDSNDCRDRSSDNVENRLTMRRNC